MQQLSTLNEFIDELTGLCREGKTCSLVFVLPSGTWGKVAVVQGHVTSLRYLTLKGAEALTELAKSEGTDRCEYTIRMDDAQIRKGQSGDISNAEFFNFFNRPAPHPAIPATRENGDKEAAPGASGPDRTSPRHAPPSAPAEPKPAGTRPPDANSRDRILVVDDSRVARKYLTRILNEAGYETHEAVNGFEALGTLSSIQPDLMILDLMLPDVDGFKVLAAAKRVADWHMPVFILTGRDSLMDKLKAKMVAPEEYLTKPVEGSLLLEKISEHLKVG